MVGDLSAEMSYSSVRGRFSCATSPRWTSSAITGSSKTRTLLRGASAAVPVTREEHHGVTMVTGWDEAVGVLNDAETFSSCISVTGPFPGFPVPLEGDDVTELIERHRDELPFSDQLPTLDPPAHTNHRSLLMRLITPSASRRTRTPCGCLPIGCSMGSWLRVRANSSRDSRAPSRCWSSPTCWGAGRGPRYVRQQHPPALRRRCRGTGTEALAHNPLEFLYGAFGDYVRERRRAPATTC